MDMEMQSPCVMVLDRGVPTEVALTSCGIGADADRLRQEYAKQTERELSHLTFEGVEVFGHVQLLSLHGCVYDASVPPSSDLPEQPKLSPPPVQPQEVPESADPEEVAAAQEAAEAAAAAAALAHRPRERIPLVGRLRVRVVDVECQMDTSLDVSMSNTVEDVQRMYVQVAHRVLHVGAQLQYRSPHARDSDEYKVLEPTHTMHEVGVDPAGLVELVFLSPPFTITLKTKKVQESLFDREVAETHSFEVRDHTKVRELRDMLRSKMRDDIRDDARLLRNTDVLDDDKELFRYKITANTEIYVEPDDKGMLHEYVCASCGSDVRLKRTDAIRCRVCGNRIVYKRRTRQPVQYLAR